MTNAALWGKPDAGNPHVRFDEGKVVPVATLRRGSLLYKRQIKCFAAIAALCVNSATFAMASSGAVIQLDNRSTVLWRTVKPGETVSFSIDWPDGAASAELNLYSRGSLASGPHAVVRNGNFSGGYIDVEIPVPSSQEDERVYEAVLSFKGADGNLIADATKTERIASVTGGGNARPTVICSNETANQWSAKVKRIDKYVVFQMPDSGKTLYVDGAAVDTGLNGAAGWFEMKLDEGTHTAQLGDGEAVSFNFTSANGVVIILR